MKDYRLQVEFLSPGLPGAGEGWASVIDTDLVFDSHGLPYLPSRRLKGALRESAAEVLEMLQCAGISYFYKVKNIIEHVFGKAGNIKGGAASFTNLHIPQYDEVAAWCNWALQEFGNILSPEVIIDSFTEIRQQTSIDENGLPEEQSLRRTRVLKNGMLFEGTLYFDEQNSNVQIGKAIDLIALSCANLRQLGTMRNRGYGRTRCILLEGDENISDMAIEKLEREAG